MRSKFAFLVMLAILSTTTFAQDSSGLNFKALGNLKLQHMNFGSKGDAVDDRKLNGIGVEALLGFNWNIFIAGLGGEYNLIYQQTDKKDVDNTNLGGTLINYSAAAGVALGDFLLLGKYHFLSEYSLRKKNPAGDEVIFQDPDFSYTLSLLYRTEGSSFWALNYTSITYAEASIAGKDGSLDSEKMHLTSFGLSYGHMF